MKRYAFLLALHCFGILAFSQSGTANSQLPHSELSKPLFEINRPQIPQITMPTRRWSLDSLSGLKSAQSQMGAGDANQLLHAPTMNGSTQFAALGLSPSPVPYRSPMAKLEPIPTQWPKAKFEQIPTTWPDLKIQQTTEPYSFDRPK